MGKRANGEGSIRRLDDRDLWQGRITIGGARRTVYGKSRAEVVQKIDSLKAAPIKDPTKLTVEEWALEWLDVYSKPAVRRSTWERYRYTVNDIMLPYLGKYKMVAVTPVIAQKFTNSLSPRLAPGTINLVLICVKMVFRKAVKLKMIAESPFDDVAKVSGKPKEKVILTVEQCRKLMRENSDHWIHPLVALAVYTGMRFGEMLALRWSDIDIGRKTISVSRTRAYVGRGYEFNDPKTSAGKRTIAMPEPLVEIIAKKFEQHQDERRRRGITWNDDRVFVGIDGGMISCGSGNYALKAACRRAGVPEVTFHCLRHSHATHLLELGVNPRVVQERLGHSQVSVTLGIYSHVSRDQHRKTADLLASALG